MIGNSVSSGCSSINLILYYDEQNVFQHKIDGTRLTGQCGIPVAFKNRKEMPANDNIVYRLNYNTQSKKNKFSFECKN